MRAVGLRRPGRVPGVLDERDRASSEHLQRTERVALRGVEGGWLGLEAHRPLFNSPDFHAGLREFLLVDDKCVSVLAVEPPEIIDLGSDPSRPIVG